MKTRIVDYLIQVSKYLYRGILITGTLMYLRWSKTIWNKCAIVKQTYKETTKSVFYLSFMTSCSCEDTSPVTKIQLSNWNPESCLSLNTEWIIWFRKCISKSVYVSWKEIYSIEPLWFTVQMLNQISCVWVDQNLYFDAYCIPENTNLICACPHTIIGFDYLFLLISTVR